MSVELWFIGVAFCLAAATSAAQAMARRDPLRAGLAVVMLVNLGMSMSLSAWQGWPARQLDLAAWCLALAMWPWCLKAGDDGEPSQARHWPLRGLAAWLVAGMLPGLLAAGTVSGVLAEQVSLWGRLAVAAWLVGAVWGQVSRRLDAAWAGLISAGALWGAWVAAGAAALGLETQTTMQAGQTGAWALCGVGLGLRRLQHLRAQLEAGRRTDPQTGLMSRDAWWELAEQQCDGAERHDYWLTVVVLGLTRGGRRGTGGPAPSPSPEERLAQVPAQIAQARAVLCPGDVHLLPEPPCPRVSRPVQLDRPRHRRSQSHHRLCRNYPQNYPGADCLQRP